MFKFFKAYHQLEHSDCGLTCIRMIARHYGAKIPIKYFQQNSDLSRQGMSIQDIVTTCKTVGLNATAIRLDIRYALQMPLPAILYWNQNHFVVLYKVDHKRGRLFIADPAQGKLICPVKMLEKFWTSGNEDKGIAILAEPEDDFFLKEYPHDNIIHEFIKYCGVHLSRYRHSFICAIMITAFIMAADFITPILLRHTIDEGIENKDINIIIILLISQLAITIGGLAASVSMEWVLTKTGLGMYMDMVKNFLVKLANLPLSYFDMKVSSDFVQKINDQSRIKDFLISSPTQLLVTTLTLIVFSILLCHYSLTIFVIIAIFSVVELFWNASFLSARRSLDTTSFTLLSENKNHAYELTNGMQDLKVNNAEKTRIEMWTKNQVELNKTSLKSSKLSILQSSGHGILSRIKELSVTGLCTFMIIEGDMTIGMMVTLSYITGRVTQPFTQLSSSLSIWQSALISYQRIDDVINRRREVKRNVKINKFSIELNNVWFKYAGSASPYVIKNFSLLIPQGKVTALVGESGCGKSTLIKLMLGLYAPHKGTILLGDYDCIDINSSCWVANCGVVLQDGKIFSGSIFQNIAFSDPNEENILKVKELLRVVGLDNLVENMPMGIHTQLGVAGTELSGGQKQRLMIARALYKNPNVLFLDEATSSLDAHNERTVVDNIRIFGKDKTIVIAAHRLSTVIDADQIIYIKNGEIAEIGSHNELIAREGEYWNLVKNQLQLSM